jgi:hypothetical protein
MATSPSHSPSQKPADDGGDKLERPVFSARFYDPKVLKSSDYSTMWWFIKYTDAHAREKILYVPASKASHEKRQKLFADVFERPYSFLGLGQLVLEEGTSSFIMNPDVVDANELFSAGFIEKLLQKKK